VRGVSWGVGGLGRLSPFGSFQGMALAAAASTLQVGEAGDLLTLSVDDFEFVWPVGGVQVNAGNPARNDMAVFPGTVELTAGNLAATALFPCSQAGSKNQTTLAAIRQGAGPTAGYSGVKVVHDIVGDLTVSAQNYVSDEFPNGGALSLPIPTADKTAEVVIESTHTGLVRINDSGGSALCFMRAGERRLFAAVEPDWTTLWAYDKPCRCSLQAATIQALPHNTATAVTLSGLAYADPEGMGSAITNAVTIFRNGYYDVNWRIVLNGGTFCTALVGQVLVDGVARWERTRKFTSGTLNGEGAEVEGLVRNINLTAGTTLSLRCTAGFSSGTDFLKGNAVHFDGCYLSVNEVIVR
jgi:hypothetical protein